MTAAKPSRLKQPTLVGWRERISLPELGLPLLVAKIDTGARTSALHATRIVRFQRDGQDWVRFHIPHASGLRARDCEAPLVDMRAVKNTSGTPEDRLVIETLLALGPRHWRIEITLADRAAMTLPIILGRTALRRHRILVEPGKSFMTGHPGPVSHAPKGTAP